MKQICLFLCALFIGCSASTQSNQSTQNTKMPDKMADSYLLIRPGVQDLGAIKTGEFFLSKSFQENTLLDGSISTARYGKPTLKGNTYSLPIEFLKNGVVQSTLTYDLEYQGDSTLLTKVYVKNQLTGEYQEASDYETKAVLIATFTNIQVPQDSSTTN